MEDEIGDERLLERRRESLDELRGQAANEPDRVGDEVAPSLVDEAPGRGIERLEQAIVDGDVRIGKSVEECGLADVRVPGEGDDRRRRALTLAPPDLPLLRELREAPTQQRDASPRDPAVGLELALTRATRPDARAERACTSAQTLEVLPHAAHPREVVLELGQLDLQLSLGSDGVLGEDVEDQLRAVDDPRLQGVLEGPLLRGVEFAVHEQDLGAGLSIRTLQLVELAFSDIRPPVRMRPVLDEIADGLDHRGAGELMELAELLVGVDALWDHCNDEPALGGGVVGALHHERRVRARSQNRVVPAERLAQRALELVNIHSPSRGEAEIAAYVADAIELPRVYANGDVLFAGRRRAGRPLVVLAGHLDTVPAQDNFPGRREDGVVVGLGASDMKGGLAVMIELARTLTEPELDLAYLLFTREELAAGESPLPRFFEDCPEIAEAELVVMMEPTDNTVQAGCLGNLNARLVYTGTSAHSARPWLGDNAIHRAIRGLAELAALQPLDVEVEGLVFREVVSVVGIRGGIAQNVVPDRAEAEVNYRYAPNRSPADAEKRLRELTGEAMLEDLANSPPAHVAADTPLVNRLRAAGDFALEAKQAWTPVAEFAARGLDAVNFGPGATRYAHRRDERVEVAELVRSYEALARFAGGSV
ncbi:MAG: succinyl-diaminopimelate desuccinylase [Gaiellaceae bacterium]|nr:succinyl-diaminopimelate desuccinylase [Gaiellaceae bacterium]